MSHNFFSRFPLIEYNLGDADYITLTNITKNVDANDFFANTSSYYTYHDIIDGERPDTISYKLYGSPDYYWTFFILNNELRDGLNRAWPLSSAQLERMLEQEYDKYSCLTLMPHSASNNGIGISGLPNFIFLHSSYLPFLRFVSASGIDEAMLLKYDSSLLQMLVYDIVRSDGSGVPPTIMPFMQSAYYTLKWVNPYEVDSDDYVENERLRIEFVDRTLALYKEFDPWTINTDLLEELETEEQVQAEINKIKSEYIFNKRYLGAPQQFKWASYRNAASEYFVYDEFDSEKRLSVSAYDVITSTDVAQPNYISFAERETLLNERKEKIRVVRKERIRDFVDTYFQILN